MQRRSVSVVLQLRIIKKKTARYLSGCLHIKAGWILKEVILMPLAQVQAYRIQLFYRHGLIQDPASFHQLSQHLP
jgi:hypothetical protein